MSIRPTWRSGHPLRTLPRPPIPALTTSTPSPLPALGQSPPVPSPSLPAPRLHPCAGQALAHSFSSPNHPHPLLPLPPLPHSISTPTLSLAACIFPNTVPCVMRRMPLRLMPMPHPSTLKPLSFWPATMCPSETPLASPPPPPRRGPPVHVPAREDPPGWLGKYHLPAATPPSQNTLWRPSGLPTLSERSP